MIKKMILKTYGMYNNKDPNDRDYELWKSIADFMEGETAFVTESHSEPEKYVFLSGR